MGREDNLKCNPTYGPGRQFKMLSHIWAWKTIQNVIPHMGLEDNLKCYPTYGPGRQYKITSALCHDIVYIVPFLNQNRNTTLTINLQLYIYYQTLLFLLFSK